MINLVVMLEEKNIKYLAADASYSKIQFVAPVVAAGFPVVGK